VTAGRAVVLVLDEHLTAAQAGLAQRGIDARTVHEFNAASTSDPDVIRAIDRQMAGPWVLVTMDGTIVDEHRGFDWHRYAIAWIKVPPHVRGAAFEYAKVDVIQRHAHQVVEQVPGDHYTYTERQRFKHPPSLMSHQRP
jgi:hypothetical protein